MNENALKMVANERVYVKPNIPGEKLRNALKSYASGAHPGDVLILVDDTLWGGAREGMIVTGNMIYCKELGYSPKHYHLKELHRINHENKSVYVNSNKFFTHCIVEPYAVSNVVDFIAKMKTEGYGDEGSALGSGIYKSGSPEDQVMRGLPQNRENFIRQYQNSLIPAQRAKSIVNFADDFLDKMFAVSVEQENKAFRRDVFEENRMNKDQAILTHAFLNIAMHFPDYISQGKSYDPRFISFLKKSDIVSFEFLSYVSFKMQFLLEPHLGHEDTCGIIEIYLWDCIMKYANKMFPPQRNRNTVAGLFTDPREEMRQNEIVKRYSDRVRHYFCDRNNDLNMTLFEGVIESIHFACLIAMNDDEKATHLSAAVAELLGRNIYESICSYRPMMDKAIETVLCKALK